MPADCDVDDPNVSGEAVPDLASEVPRPVKADVPDLAAVFAGAAEGVVKLNGF